MDDDMDSVLSRFSVKDFVGLGGRLEVFLFRDTVEKNEDFLITVVIGNRDTSEGELVPCNVVKLKGLLGLESLLELSNCDRA